MTKPEAEWLAASMKKEGWPDVRVEPEVGSGYIVAFRRTRDEAHRHARSLSPTIQTRFERESERQKAVR